jgi:hypothetical protein
MESSKRFAIAQPRQSRRLWSALLVAGGSLLVVLGGRALSAHGDSSQSRALVQEGGDRAATSSELAELRNEVRLLARQVGAMQMELAQRPRRDEAPEVSATGKSADHSIAPARPEAEVRAEMFQTFDTLLANDTVDPAGRRQSEKTIGAELSQALPAQARSGVNCASDFCRVVIDEDTSVPPLADVASLYEKAPSLARNTLFNYETAGTRKRTIMYVAREGHTLPVPQQPGQSDQRASSLPSAR